ncbi:MAG: T9SS type A sorting domain-containing protein [Crocinitomicaceae bacterium]
MMKTFTLLALLNITPILSTAQIVTYDITPADFIGLELTTGDICSAPFTGPEEARQVASGNTWGFTWTSTNGGTPSSITINFSNTITDGGGVHPTTLNSNSTGNVTNGTAINCTGGSNANSWSISTTGYVSLGLNTFNVDFSASSMVNQFDHFPATTDVYFQVEVDYTPCTPPTIAEIITNISCNGEMDGEIDLTISGGTAPYSFDWNNDGTGDFDDTEDLTGLAPGEYIVSVQSTGGCTQVDTFTVTEPAVLDLTVTQDKSTLTANATGATYQWIDCATMTPIAGATNASYTATSNGDYAVIITDGSCSDTSACSTVSSVGIDQIKELSVDLFPNPTATESNLKIEGYTGSIKYELYSISGKLLYKNSGNIQSTVILPIDLTDFERGVYFLNVEGESLQKTFKVIKK